MTVQPALPPVPGKKSVNAFITELHKLLGKPYVFGDAGPNAFDCSGLVQYALEHSGFSNVPRTSEAQWAWTQHVNRSSLQAGDLVFSQWPGDNASPGHVQVYIGGGKVIGANHSGAPVQITTLASDAGHIVGFGRPPGMGNQVLPGSVPAGTGGGGPSVAQIGGLLSEAGTLLHGFAEVLDWVFAFFAPGQGWRIAFGAASAASGYAAVRTFTARGTAGAAFPLSVGLAGVCALTGFMALRPWPQEAGGSEKPGKYLAEILSGQPPPAGPARVHETDVIEAGLAVFATAWLASKAATGISSIIGGIGGFLSGIGGGAAGEAAAAAGDAAA